MGLKLMVTAVIGLAAFYFGQRIIDENRYGKKIHSAPSPDVGVDVSVRE